MPVLNDRERLLYLDELIDRAATGDPEQLAARLDLPPSTLKRYLGQLRKFGASIGYCRRLRTYYYCDDRRLFWGYYPPGEGGRGTR